MELYFFDLQTRIIFLARLLMIGEYVTEFIRNESKAVT